MCTHTHKWINNKTKAKGLENDSAVRVLAALSGNLGLIPNIFVIAYYKQASRGKQREAERERHERGETGQREAESGVVVGRGSRHSKADLAFTVEPTGYTQPHRIPRGHDKRRQSKATSYFV